MRKCSSYNLFISYSSQSKIVLYFPWPFYAIVILFKFWKILYNSQRKQMQRFFKVFPCQV